MLRYTYNQAKRPAARCRVRRIKPSGQDPVHESCGRHHHENLYSQLSTCQQVSRSWNQDNASTTGVAAYCSGTMLLLRGTYRPLLVVYGLSVPQYCSRRSRVQGTADQAAAERIKKTGAAQTANTQFAGEKEAP